MKRTHAKPIRRTLLLIPILLALALAGCAVGTAPVDATTATAGETGEITGTIAETVVGTVTGTVVGTVVETAAGTTAIAEATEPAEYDASATPVRLTRGATVRPTAPVGLRFSGMIDRTYFDALTAAYGENAVKVGVIITATENLTANSLDFTVESLDGCEAIVGEKYVRIDATIENSGADSIPFNCVFSDLEKNDYETLYSAVAFVEVNGRILRYSSYLQTINTARFIDVAETAFLDLSDTKSGKYRNEVTIGSQTKYSPYTAAQRETLAEICFPHSFTVMSYNVAVYDSPSGGAGWEGRDPAKVAETVLSASPDVVGFQEVNQKGSKGWNSTLAQLAADGGYTRLEGEYTWDGFEKNEIFFKTEKFDKLIEGTITFKKAASDLSVPNTENANNSLDKHGRTFHYVGLEQKETGRKLLVVNTHLHYGGTGSGHEEDDKVRRFEIRTLLAWLEGQKETYPDVIVTGDLNAHYNAAVASNGGTRNMKVFFDGGFERTSDTAKIKGDLDGTLASGSQRASRDLRYTFDYVLTRGDFSTVFYSVVDNPIDNQNSYPSDHIPVMAEICFR